jgi:NitT/TauT family transport system ATP-binding protein
MALLNPMNTPASTLVSLHGVSKVFTNGVTALSGFDLAIRTGEFLSLLGPSGCGKSTALRRPQGMSRGRARSMRITAARSASCFKNRR